MGYTESRRRECGKDGKAMQGGEENEGDVHGRVQKVGFECMVKK